MPKMLPLVKRKVLFYISVFFNARIDKIANKSNIYTQ